MHLKDKIRNSYGDFKELKEAVRINTFRTAKASEDIIIVQIKNYFKYERNLLIINDNIKQLENVFNN